MKYILVLALVAVAAADVSHVVGQQGSEVGAQVLRSDVDIKPDGNYEYNYETSNGIVGQAVGTYKLFPEDTGAVVVQGSNQWKSPEGEQIQLTYVADENGYQPQGAHLPTPPPVPDYILRSIQYIQEHPVKEEPQ